MRILRWVILWSLVLTTSTFAGPWLREKGRAFSSSWVSIDKAKNIQTSSYFEYGATEHLTLGADIFNSYPYDQKSNGQGILFLRKALGTPESEHRLAYELGVGANWSSGQSDPLLKATLSWGRGWQSAHKSGWITVTGADVYNFTTHQHTQKLDTTFGINLNEQFKTLAELNMDHSQGKTNIAVAPSIVFRPKDSSFQLLTGFNTPVDKPKSTSLKFGFWREF